MTGLLKELQGRRLLQDVISHPLPASLSLLPSSIPFLRPWFSPRGGGTILKRWDFGPSCLFACLVFLFVCFVCLLFCCNGQQDV